MFLLEVEDSEVSTVKEELEGQELQVDPRPIFKLHDRFNYDLAFEISCVHHANGTTVTIRRTDSRRGWYEIELKFRVYDPAKETVPRFDTKIYTYLGVKGEHAPDDTVTVIIHPSVKVILEEAFKYCEQMTTCIMHEHVEIIERQAFLFCSALKTIKLPWNLKCIGGSAFRQCRLLDAIFIPPNIEEIGDKAFIGCRNIRIVSLPTHNGMGSDVFHLCDDLFSYYTPLEEYNMADEPHDNSERIHQSIIEFNSNQPTLHEVCLHADVTAQTIHECVRANRHRNGSRNRDRNRNGLQVAIAFTKTYCAMTPLHVIAMNPYADTGAILECFHLNMHAAIEPDEKGMNVIDYLWEYGNVDCLVSIIRALCI